MEIIELILSFLASLFPRKERIKRVEAGLSDVNFPVCGVQVFLTDKEFKRGSFTCRNCGYGGENTRLK